MPDKDIMVQIKALEEQRAWSALDVMADPSNASDFVRVLIALASDMRGLAALYEQAKGRGFKTLHVDPLRTAAKQLDIVIKQLEQPRRAPAGELQPKSVQDPCDMVMKPHAPHAWTHPDSNIGVLHCPGVGRTHKQIEADAGLDEPVHVFKPGGEGKCAALVTRDGSGPEYCNRYASHPAHRATTPMTAATLQGLDALIEISVAEARGTIRPPTDAAVTSGALVDGGSVSDAASTNDVAAYLRGETDDIATVPPRALVGAHDQTEVPPVTAEEMAAYRRGEVDPESELHAYVSDPRAQLIEPRTAREILENSPVTMPPAPLLGQPGDAGSGYDHSYIPAGGVPMTYAELLTPVPAAALPPHLSHSQIGTLGACPAKYRGTRLPNTDGIARTLTEIPQWANIGGSAFHAWVEAEERLIAEGHRGRMPGDVDDYQREWNEAFDAEIQKIEATSPVPRARWRAANKGMEHEAWWRANGPKMLERYLAARPDEPTATFALPSSTDAFREPAIELERIVKVPTGYGEIEYKAILDRVTMQQTEMGFTRLVIRDYKTGRAPDSTQQLGEYANVLRLLGVPPNIKIVGTYFLARKGEWTKEVEVEREWPMEWFQYHLTTGYAQRLALTTGPTPARPTSFCGGCPVRWACPVKTPQPVAP